MDRVATLPVTVTPAAAEGTAATRGYSRFPVTTADGTLTGYVHIKDLLETDPTRRDQPINPDLIRPLIAVRRTDPIRQVLATMKNTGAHLATVTDDNDTTIGIVALEDVLQELVGQIRDDTRRTAA